MIQLTKYLRVYFSSIQIDFHTAKLDVYSIYKVTNRKALDGCTLNHPMLLTFTSEMDDLFFFLSVNLG